MSIGNPEQTAWAPRSVWRSLKRGFALRCPNCGRGRVLSGYLTVADACPACGEELHHQRADDAPPYFTILIVGHIIGPLVLALEEAAHPPLWVQWGIWIPATLLAAFALLPRVKGALVALQWALRMHGFGGETEEPPAATGS